MPGVETTKRNRILALDLLRGLFLFIIFADHLAWTPSLFFQFSTAYTGMFASAAEGFFTMSGILVGYIYGPRFLKQTKVIVLKLWKRSILLYLLAVAFTFFYTAWGYVAMQNGTNVRNGVGSIIPFDSIWGSTLLLSHTYGWADFLGRYAVFMFFAPLALWCIVKGKAYLVIIASVLIWFFLRENTNFLTFAAWQIIFMPSIIIGYYLPRIESAFKNRRVLLTSVASFSVFSYIFVFLLFALIPLVIASTGLTDPLLNAINGIRLAILPLFDKTSMALPRLLIGIIWFCGLYIIFRTYESQIEAKTRGILSLVGRYSLFVYSFEAFLIFLMDILITPPENIRPDLLLLNTFIGILGAVIIILATYVYNRFKTGRNHT